MYTQLTSVIKMVRQSLRGKGTSPKKYFRTDEYTEFILAKLVNQSEFIRNAIAYFYKHGVGLWQFYCTKHKRECNRSHSAPKRIRYGFIGCSSNPYTHEILDKMKAEGYEGFACPHLQEKLRYYESEDAMHNDRRNIPLSLKDKTGYKFR